MEKNNHTNKETLSKKKEKIKEKRKNQYDNANQISKSVSGNFKIAISEIKIEEFAEVRKREMQSFINILQTKYNTKSGHQLLPKHMRRRAMSHNPFRIPLEFRLNTFNSAARSKCSKHTKKKTQLLKSLNRRKNANGWLETHIWHAKRFRMTDLFGVRIPLRRADKSTKACYRFSKYGSVLYDKSYYRSLFCEFESKESLDLFFELHGVANLETCWEFLLYSSKGELIGPVEVVLIDLENFRLILNFHPLMLFEVMALLEGRFKGKFDFQKNLNCFEVHGNCDNIDKVVKLLRQSIKNNTVVDFERMDPQRLSLEIGKPFHNFKMNELSLNHLVSKAKQSNQEENSEFEMILESNIKQNDWIYAHLKDNSKISNIVELEHRTNFFNRKKKDLEKINKKLSKSLEVNRNTMTVKFSEKITNRGIPMEIDNKAVKPLEAVDVNKKIYGFSNESTYIIINKCSYAIEEANWSWKNIESHRIFYRIYFIKGIARNLLKMFSYLNTKILGLEEFRNLFKESSYLFFPDDYPSTRAYGHFTKQNCLDRIDRYLKYPPSKRVNHQKINNPFPFYPSWNSLNKFINFNKDLVIVEDIESRQQSERQFKRIKNIKNENTLFVVPIFIKMVEKGIPSFNSLICLPRKALLGDYIRYLKLRKSCEMPNMLDGLGSGNSSTIDQSFEDYFFLKEYEKNRIEAYSEELYKTKAKAKFWKRDFEIIEDILFNPESQNKVYQSDLLDCDLRVKCRDIKFNIAGFVTSGGNSFEFCKGIAKGYITASAFKEILTMKQELNIDKNFVLIRSPNSRTYRYANFRTLSLV